MMSPVSKPRRLSTSDDNDNEPKKEKIIRDAVFPIHYPECDPVTCQIILTPTELVLEECDESGYESDSGSGRERYPIEDIFGFHIVQKKAAEPSLPTVYVCIIFYTHESEKAGSRSRVARLLEINQSRQSYEGNLNVAKEWALDIANVLQTKLSSIYSSRPPQDSPDDSDNTHQKIISKIENVFDSLKSNPLDKPTVSDDDSLVVNDIDLIFCDESFSLVRTVLLERKFLVIVNPVSGQGKSVNLLNEQILPVFADSGIRTHLLTTERIGHAASYVSKFDFSNVDGIISVGGDGVLNEIVNALRKRVNAKSLAHIPIGIIATGSGNGLARSLSAYYDDSEEYKSNPVLYSTLSVARGCIIPVNLTEVSLDKRVFYSFLSVGWGILSDIDIESEVLRSIGEIRFFIWSFIRLAKLRRYKAELSYIPYDSSGSISSRVIVNDDFVSVYSVCQSHIGTEMFFAPDAKPNDGVIHLTYLPSNTGRLATAKFLIEVQGDKGQHLHVEPVKYVKVKEFTIRCDGGIEGCLTVDGEQVTGEEITVRLSDTPLLMFGLG